MKTITVEVDRKGIVLVTTEGYTGQSCKEATKALEAALGKKVSDVETPEAMQHEADHLSDTA